MNCTEQQIEKAINKIFVRYDEDQDGFLNREEVIRMIKGAYEILKKRAPHLDEVEDFMTRYDRNRDDKIDKHELTICFS